MASQAKPSQAKRRRRRRRRRRRQRHAAVHTPSTLHWLYLTNCFVIAPNRGCITASVYVLLRKRPRWCRATPPTTNLRHRPATAEIPLDPLGLTPTLFSALSECFYCCCFLFFFFFFFLFKLLSSDRSHRRIHVRTIAASTNPSFLHESLATLSQDESFHACGGRCYPSGHHHRSNDSRICRAQPLLRYRTVRVPFISRST